MIIPERLIQAAEYLLISGEYTITGFVIDCDSKGYFTGKVKGNGRILFAGSKRKTFKKAMNDILDLCYEQVSKDEE